MRVAVIMPTLNRAGQLRRNAGDLLMQMPPDGVEVIVVFAVQRGDRHTLAVISNFANMWADSGTSVIVALREPGTTCVQGFNVGYERVRLAADWYVLGSDDQVYGDGWLEAALTVADSTGAQVIGLNDGHTDIGKYAPHYMMHRDFIEQVMGGVMVPPVYQSWWFDREVCERAAALGLYAAAWRAQVDHMHPDWGTADMDDTYRGEWHKHDIDRDTYERRRAAGYPVDYLEAINA